MEKDLSKELQVVFDNVKQDFSSDFDDLKIKLDQLIVL